MKKYFIIGSVIVGSVALVGVVVGALFWWYVLLVPPGPEFIATPQGTFTAEPTVEKSGDTYTIIWSTTDNYPNNEVVMKSDASKYPDAGVGADSAYDATNGVYVHTATFRLSNSTETNITGNTPEVNNDDFKIVPVFAEGKYTYQVKSSGLPNQEAVVSNIFPL